MPQSSDTLHLTFALLATRRSDAALDCGATSVLSCNSWSVQAVAILPQTANYVKNVTICGESLCTEMSRSRYFTSAGGCRGCSPRFKLNLSSRYCSVR